MWLMQFTHYLFGYVGTVLCSVGLVFALCSVYIFTRRQMRSAVATYLAGLSISDSCLLSLGLIIAINASIPPDKQSELYYSSHLHKQLFPYVYPCIIWFQFTSVWITIGFAIDRWFAIKWPMLHYTYSSKRASYIVLTIYCLGFLYSFPRFFEYKTESKHELIIMGNLTEYVDYLVITNRLLDNRLYHYIVHLVLYSLFQSILPLLLLSYFNVELIRSINASSHFLKRFTSLHVHNTRKGRETLSPRYREGTITRSVVCLIGLFTLCQIPASILHYIHMFYRNHPILYICYDISNFLILLNSAVNFFVFTYFNRKFRHELARVCYQTKDTLSTYSHTHSRPSFRQSNSQNRIPNHNSQILQQFDVTPTISWDYQQRNSHRPLQRAHAVSNESIEHLRKKSSDLSIQSHHHLHPLYQHSESSLDLRTSNTNNHKETERQRRFSIYDFNYKPSKKPSDPADSKKLPNYPRRYSDRLSLKGQKYPFQPSSPNHFQQPRQYTIYHRTKKAPQTVYSSKPTRCSTSSTTTTSNLTRSTMNTTGSESSILIDQIKPTKLGIYTSEKSSRYFRKQFP